MPVARALERYRHYSGMAEAPGISAEMRTTFRSMAREALRQAAKLDPAAVAHASSDAMAAARASTS
jgi:hypothetical protein